MPRSALLLFLSYLLFYGAYVGCAAFAPAVMGRQFAGVGAAVWWGLALIVLPVLLAAVYLWLRRGTGAAP